MEATNYLPCGAKVRRRVVPGEPGSSAIGTVVAATLDGKRVFVSFSGRGTRTTEMIAADEIERVSAKEKRWKS
jgi:hypothetical protein